MMEKEFSDSWKGMRVFFTELHEEYDFKIAKTMLEFIGKFQAAGLDSKFRAGQSLHFLLLSRCRQHGLGMKDPLIHIAALENNEIELVFVSENGSREKDRVFLDTFNPENHRFVWELLNRDLHEPRD